MTEPTRRDGPPDAPVCRACHQPLAPGEAMFVERIDGGMGSSLYVLCPIVTRALHAFSDSATNSGVGFARKKVSSRPNTFMQRKTLHPKQLRPKKIRLTVITVSTACAAQRSRSCAFTTAPAAGRSGCSPRPLSPSLPSWYPQRHAESTYLVVRRCYAAL